MSSLDHPGLSHMSERKMYSEAENKKTNEQTSLKLGEKVNLVDPSDGQLVCSGCHNRIPQTGWLQQQKFNFSQFWRLRVQDQELVSGEDSSWLADGYPLTVSSHGLSSVSTCRRDLWHFFFFL